MTDEMVEPEIVREGRELVRAITENGGQSRLMGGIGIFLRCPSARLPALSREYGDIDLVGRGKDRRAIEAAMGSRGFGGDDELNALHGHSRLWFHHRTRPEWKVDVFLDEVKMCHDMRVGDRVSIDPETLPLADLLLLKLQIFETNEKDLKDMVALLSDHRPAEGGELDCTRIREILGSDWGWWRTCTMVLDRVRQFGDGLGDQIDREALGQSIAALEEAIEGAPKSMKWKARNRIGDRKRWYELPTES